MTAPKPSREPERFACANCRRPLHWVEGVGWLHGELPQYAHEEPNCGVAAPVCQYSTCDHTAGGPDPDCPCKCHRRGGKR